jgi:NAD(P)-dependent dehydrogenase (short-subunit alcohol dehydrogenase family)
MDRLLRDVRDRHKRLDVLVANAGSGRHARLARSRRRSSTRRSAQT